MVLTKATSEFFPGDGVGVGMGGEIRLPPRLSCSSQQTRTVQDFLPVQGRRAHYGPLWPKPYLKKTGIPNQLSGRRTSAEQPAGNRRGDAQPASPSSGAQPHAVRPRPHGQQPQQRRPAPRGHAATPSGVRPALQQAAAAPSPMRPRRLPSRCPTPRRPPSPAAARGSWQCGTAQQPSTAALRRAFRFQVRAHAAVAREAFRFFV
jgi:hypothetical protein